MRQNSNGNWEWLTDTNKDAVVINGDTYDARVPSSIDPGDTSVVIKHNEFGIENGVITLKAA